MKRHLLLIGVLLLSWSTVSALPNVSPWDAWRLGYTNFEQGEKFREQGNYTKALAAFRKAKSYYEAVKQRRPDWNQKVISERIRECESESMKMQNLLGSSGKTAGVAEPETPTLPHQYTDSKTVSQLRQRLANTLAEVKELRQKAADQRNFEQEITNLIRDQRIIREKYTLLLKRNRALEQQKNAPDTQVQELKNLLVEEKMKSDLKGRKLETASLRLRELAAARLQSEQKLKESSENLRRLQLENANLRTSVTSSTQQNTAIQQKIEKLERQLNAEQTKLVAQQKNLADRDRELASLQEKYRQKLASAGAGEAVNAKLLQENRQLQEERTQLRRTGDAQKQEQLKLKNLVAEKEAKITQLTTTQAQNTAAIKQLKQQIAEGEKKLNLAQANAQLTDIDLKKMRAQNLNTERTIKELTENNAALKKRLEFRDQQESQVLKQTQTQRKKWQETQSKLENELATLRAERTGLAEKLAENQKQQQELRSENRKLQAERINFQEKFQSVSGAYENIRNLPKRYEELKRNFTALQAENRANRRAAEAAKPQAAELSQIKIRLLELDRLKDQLAREQRFNEELNVAKRELEKEVKELRPLEQRMANYQAQSKDLLALKKEVERLRKLSGELAEAQKLAPELADLKLKFAQIAPQAAEAQKLRTQNAELRVAKSLWENEQTQLKTQLARAERLKTTLKNYQDKLAAAEKQLHEAERVQLQQKQQLTEFQATHQQGDKLQKRHEKLIADYAALTSEFRKLSLGGIERNHQLARLEKSDKTLRRNNRELVDAIAKQAEKIEELNRRLKASHSARNLLEQSLNDREKTLKELLANSSAAVAKVQKQLLSQTQAQQKKIQKLEAANVVMEQFWSTRAKDQTKKLRDQYLEATSLLKERDTQIQELRRSLLMFSQLKSDLISAQSRQKIAEERYEKLSKLPENQRFALQLKMLQQDVAKLQTANQNLRQEKLRLLHEREKLHQAGRQDRDQDNKIEQQLAATQKALTQKEQELQKLAIDFQALKTQVAHRNNQEAEQIRAQLKLAEDQKNTLRESVVELQNKFTQLDRDRNELGGRLGFVNNELDQLKKQAAELKIRLTSSSTENTELTRRLTQLRHQYQTLQEVNRKNVNFEQLLSDSRQKVLLQKETIHKLQDKVATLATTEAQLKNSQSELLKQSQELANYIKLSENSQQLRQELIQLRKLNQELAEAKLKTDTALAQKTSQLSETDRLRRELVQLRRLNSELAGAKLLEAELTRAKLRINQLEQLRDEISKIRQLNETLHQKNRKLTRELERRPKMPAFVTDSYQFSTSSLTKPKGKAEDYLHAGMLAERNESEELAIWNYRTALKLKANYPEAAERLGRMYANRGDYALAAPLLSSARDPKPDDVDLALETASCYIALGRYGNANAIIEPLRKRFGNQARLQLAAGQIAAGTGQSAKAANLMRIALNMAPRDPAPRLELARLLLHTDATRQEEAARYYEAARLLGAPIDLELEPKLGAKVGERREMSSFLKSAAHEAAVNKDWRGAIWYYRQLIELGRDQNSYVPRLAYAQYKKGTPGAALETLTMNRTTALGALTASLIHFKNRDFQPAEQALRQAQALNGGRKINLPAEWTEFVLDYHAASAEKSAWGKKFRDAAVLTAQ